MVVDDSKTVDDADEENIVVDCVVAADTVDIVEEGWVAAGLSNNE